MSRGGTLDVDDGVINQPLLALVVAIRWWRFGQKETNKVHLHCFDSPTREEMLKEVPQGEISDVLV